MTLASKPSMLWAINSCAKVEVTLTTHDAGDNGGLSQRDAKLARTIDGIAA